MTVLGPQRNTVVLVVSWDELDMLHTGVAAYTSDYEGANTSTNLERGIPLARKLSDELQDALGARVVT